MPAPTASDGLRRAAEEILLPPVGVLLIVVFTMDFAGPVVAGLVYLLLLGGIFLGIYTSAKHWNVRYTTALLNPQKASGFIV